MITDKDYGWKELKKELQKLEKKPFTKVKIATSTDEKIAWHDFLGWKMEKARQEKHLSCSKTAKRSLAKSWFCSRALDHMVGPQ